MTQTNTTNQPMALFSHTMTFMGVSIDNLLSSIGLLLSAYGVQHEVPISNSFTSESLVTGDENANARFTTEYMQFKMLLSDLARQYTRVQCAVQSNGNTVYMRFSCY